MQASQNWRWVVNPDDMQLRILLDHQQQHICPYKTSRLVPLGPLNASFSVADAEAFELFSEALASSAALTSEVIVAATLNYLIMSHFGRPQMPQSWYFQQQEAAIQYPLQLGSLVELNSGLASATFVLINHSDDVSECMLLDASMALSEIKTLHQFDVIKVLNNRLQPSAAMGSLSADSVLLRLA
ncbi:cell division protein ZapC domain-containing protein [Pseudidiomarina mangrovi]|uniref:cell division protein ZapC domain-containing protein n=1 Tax=Pseudidiomarina mangrovi TaxID=2487133 RepID=UPI000FCAF0B7|nr:cell division protein ZapC domain-containing protein [Pseudidiomarina mangrovi]CAI8167819.1 MAG: Cell division protein ZapC [Pseudidiomarina mangrovi]